MTDSLRDRLAREGALAALERLTREADAIHELFPDLASTPVRPKPTEAKPALSAKRRLVLARNLEKARKALAAKRRATAADSNRR